MTPDHYICRTVDGVEYEIGINVNVEEIYHGTNRTDDPSEATVSEEAEIVEGMGPFKAGEKILLTDAERRDIEEEEYQYAVEQAEESWAEWARDRD